MKNKIEKGCFRHQREGKKEKKINKYLYLYISIIPDKGISKGIF